MKAMLSYKLILQHSTVTMGSCAVLTMELVSVLNCPSSCRRNESSVFFGRDAVVSRIATKWADHSTVEVCSTMIAFLKDTKNTQEARFPWQTMSCINSSEGCICTCTCLVMGQAALIKASCLQAMRRMLSAALKDRANQRFILLSESCIPLYSPLIVYQQLMHEKRSRISACAVPGWERSLER